MNLIVILLIRQPTQHPILREREGEGRWIETCISEFEQQRAGQGGGGGRFACCFYAVQKQHPGQLVPLLRFPSPLHLVSFFLHKFSLPPTIFSPSATYGFITERSRYQGPNPHYFPKQSGQTLVKFPLSINIMCLNVIMPPYKIHSLTLCVAAAQSYSEVTVLEKCQQKANN